MLTAVDYHALAYWLIDAHGKDAVMWAERAVIELRLAGDTERAELWMALRSIADDLIRGRLDPHVPPTLH